MQGSDKINIDDIKDLATAKEVIKILLSKISILEERIAVLEKNSGNSSKPPSSDIVKPKHEQRQPGVRKIGGQTKHPGVKHELLAPEKVDFFKTLKLDACPGCSGKLILNNKTKIIQQYEFVEKPIVLNQYDVLGYTCKHCNCEHYAKVDSSMTGTKLQSYVAYMKSAFGISYSEIKELFQDVFAVDLSRSTLCNIIHRTSKALANSHQELALHVRQAKTINCDETGWKDFGKTYWSWLFTTDTYGLFYLSHTRSAKVIEDVLGKDFSGAITSDFYGAYRKFNFVNQQFCLAHLIRDIKFLATLPEQESIDFSNKLLKFFKRLFSYWHKRDHLGDLFISKVYRLKTRLNNFLCREKPSGKAKTLKKRIIKHWKALFRFVDEPELFSPTNNLAEQTIRFITRIRSLTQGTRGTWGTTWIQRSTTVVATCRKQKRSIYQFYLQTLLAAKSNSQFPSLIPST